MSEESKPELNPVSFGMPDLLDGQITDEQQDLAVAKARSVVI
jgi:hypothetical protein